MFLASVRASIPFCFHMGHPVHGVAVPIIYWGLNTMCNKTRFTVSVSADLCPVLHECHLLISAMVHFISQLQYYINFEVHCTVHVRVHFACVHVNFQGWALSIWTLLFVCIYIHVWVDCGGFRYMYTFFFG